MSEKINTVQNINEKFFDAKFGGVGFLETGPSADTIQTNKNRNKKNYMMGKKTHRGKRTNY